ncbi:aminomethyl-transferring glycine dehydrogenase subunit GcvPB [bacterium]|nr:aminomethyl-transferring glycine dehydrogenase subunit GcvPB [bacterium]
MKPTTTNIAFEEKLLFELSSPGRRGFFLPPLDVEESLEKLPSNLLRSKPAELPELSEADVVRHFVRLSTWNFNKDVGFYPLGSCTMKYNPKVNEVTASMNGFTSTHPYQPENTIQGNLRLSYELQQFLAEISGMDEVTCWPAAGSHGELTGMLVIKAHHAAQGNPRSKVLIPDSAHGTNPASAAICGYKCIEVKSNEEGVIDPKVVEELMDEEVAAIMITNPNTLGIFEENIKKIADIVHAKGGLVYGDGANLNAIMGYHKPADGGVDVMHFNLHKTFATPHGGGGPGSGPIGVVSKLAPFLPTPYIVKDGDTFKIDNNRPQSIGPIKTYFGNYGIMVRAYTYIHELGAAGLKLASEMAVLNSTYIKSKLKDDFHLPYGKPTLHECVFSDKIQGQYGIKTLDISKRLMDYGFHPPTIYFPLIVHGSIMIEPTETEDKASCDAFIDAMKAIAEECNSDPETVKSAPHNTFRRRFDEVKAVKEPHLRYK